MTPLLQIWLDNRAECGVRLWATANDPLAQGAALPKLNNPNRGTSAVLPLAARWSSFRPKGLCLDLWTCVFCDSHSSLHVRSIYLPHLTMTTARVSYWCTWSRPRWVKWWSGMAGRGWRLRRWSGCSGFRV